MSTIKHIIRAPVTEWVLRRFPGAVEVAPHSGQRFVFRTPAGTALKLWPPTDDVEMERCRREVDVLRTDIHGLPKALSPVESVQIDGVSLAMYEEQWLEADSVLEIVERGRYSIDLGRRILKSASAILASLHGQGVVHRDISPNNILVSSTSDVYVIDLGLAKHLDLDSITATGEHLPMTRAFASIEQITAGSSLLGRPTDVYSLALVCMWAATGTHPFLAGSDFSPSEYLSRMANRDYVSRGGLFDAVLHEMLHPLATLRPSMEKVVDRTRDST